MGNTTAVRPGEPELKGLTEDERRDFVADVTAYLLVEIESGADVFAVLSFKHKGPGQMRVTSATVKVSLKPIDERMVEEAHNIVAEVMDKLAPRWLDN